MSDTIVVRVEQADGSYRPMRVPQPECGELFCDDCGDCWHCYSEGPCRDGGLHSWIVYKDGEQAPNAKELTDGQ